MAGDKNSLLQLPRPRDRAIFDIFFVMKSCMSKLSFLFDLDKEAFNLHVDVDKWTGCLFSIYAVVFMFKRVKSINIWNFLVNREYTNSTVFKKVLTLSKM